MLILRPHAVRCIVDVFKFYERRISSVKFTSVHLYDNVYMRVGRGRGSRAGRFVRFGLLVEQSSQKFMIPCLERR